MRAAADLLRYWHTGTEEWPVCGLIRCLLSRRSRYAKVPVVRDLLLDDSIELVFWIDADAVVVSSVRLAAHLSRRMSVTRRRC